MKLINICQTWSLTQKLIFGLFIVIIVAVFEFLAGYQVEFSLFYILPVAFVTWFTNRTFGLLTSLISAVVWLAVDVAAGHPYSHLFTPIWNTFIRLSFFLVITALLSALRRTLEHEALLARTDNLTGAFNSRFFYELVEQELERFKRYGQIFSLVYIDLDNFKSVNNRFGHVIGDHALRSVVNFVQANTRKTDAVARLGGDEFALLLPQTDLKESQTVVSTLIDGLLQEMQNQQWPITFSVGVVACRKLPPTIEALVNAADELMYTIKRNGKNNIKFAVYGD
ncbi:diguanylate cyclase [candidate division KSB1 bacterium]|nr:diguanylate cyclase [candidate division KSB1 bacterium]